MKFVLVTAARNEAAYIELTIRSVIEQTVLPEKWVIVSDGSTDQTEDIVKKYLPDHPWMELLVRPSRTDRSFSGKAHAFNEGCKLMAGIEYYVIGNLDADVTFDRDYFEYLIKEFEEDEKLGVAGTHYVEGTFHSFEDSYINEEHVNGAVQMFRKACFEQIGGYVTTSMGGIDWIAVTSARMHGWRTRSFPDRVFNHLRKIGTEESTILRSGFNSGRKDYYLGGHPLWLVFRSAYSMTRKPYLAGGMCLLAGYIWAWVSCVDKPISRDLQRFHRAEQMVRLKGLFLNRFLIGRSI
jgi:biofilm PGA synthesis N-glycosyltransferase PgaC